MEFIPIYFRLWWNPPHSTLILKFINVRRNIFFSINKYAHIIGTRSLKHLSMRKVHHRTIAWLQLVLKTYIVIIKKMHYLFNTFFLRYYYFTNYKFLKMILTKLIKRVSIRTIQTHLAITHCYTTPKLYARRKRRLYRRAYQN